MTTVFEPHWVLLHESMVRDLKPGDVLRRRKTGVWHLGIFLDPDQILHNSPGTGAGERVTSFNEFACGREVHVAHSNPETRAAVIQRASGILARPQTYSYVWRNCEHTVYEIVEGMPRSPTVKLMDRMLSAAVVLSLAGLAFSFRKEIRVSAGKLVRRF
ncbi:MAG TPA: lecithin retinol acyltransferase family protein [Gammaproteobacteria bacterium]|nr:lecithin retinol acyltransferase family protein [Gammaproteobacteria bacterium]